MAPHIVGPSVRMIGMVPVLVTDGDIASDTCASQGAVFQHVLSSESCIAYFN
jgi:hypothetical protein